jgi:hypothetical protein
VAELVEYRGIYDFVPLGTLILNVSDDYWIVVNSLATRADVVEFLVKSVGVVKTVVGANEDASNMIGDAHGLAYVLEFSYEHGERIRGRWLWPYP